MKKRKRKSVYYKEDLEEYAGRLRMNCKRDDKILGSALITGKVIQMPEVRTVKKYYSKG